MSCLARRFCLFAAVFLALLLAHLPFLHLPYFWDEAGYYVPAALDFYHNALLIPRTTVPSGHTPFLMVYLGVVWRLVGFSEIGTRVAMLLVAAATVVTTYRLGRYAAGREAGVWSALLFAVSPLFFAQSSLVFLDLTAACFTALAALFLLQERWLLLVLAGIGAVMTKETAVVVLPAMWAFLLLRRRERRLGAWAALTVPLAPLGAWALYYHHHTGFWTGNPQYLQYNLYSAAQPLHVLRSLVARIYEVLIQGFNWLLIAGALVGVWFKRGTARCLVPHFRVRHRSVPSRVIFDRPLAPLGAWGRAWRSRAALREESQVRELTQNAIARNHAGHNSSAGPRTGISPIPAPQGRVGAISTTAPETETSHANERKNTWLDFNLLAGLIILAYTVMLSIVGGAVLSRYMLPAELLFLVVTVGLIQQLPRFSRQAIRVMVAAAFVLAWFINPPYPFPYENNLAYADFIRLHQQAASYLESFPGNPVILTAWPATDELRQPFLGYVHCPLRVSQVENFTAPAFRKTPRFDLLYLYSRQWEPKRNLLALAPPIGGFLQRFYDYHPQIAISELAAHHNLKLLKEYERHGQWVRIYQTCRGNSARGVNPDLSRTQQTRAAASSAHPNKRHRLEVGQWQRLGPSCAEVRRVGRG